MDRSKSDLRKDDDVDRRRAAAERTALNSRYTPEELATLPLWALSEESLDEEALCNDDGRPSAEPTAACNPLASSPLLNRDELNRNPRTASTELRPDAQSSVQRITSKKLGIGPNVSSSDCSRATPGQVDLTRRSTSSYIVRPSCMQGQGSSNTRSSSAAHVGHNSSSRKSSATLGLIPRKASATLGHIPNKSSATLGHIPRKSSATIGLERSDPTLGHIPRPSAGALNHIPQPSRTNFPVLNPIGQNSSNVLRTTDASFSPTRNSSTVLPIFLQSFEPPLLPPPIMHAYVPATNSSELGLEHVRDSDIDFYESSSGSDTTEAPTTAGVELENRESSNAAAIPVVTESEQETFPSEDSGEELLENRPISTTDAPTQATTSVKEIFDDPEGEPLQMFSFISANSRSSVRSTSSLSNKSSASANSLNNKNSSSANSLNNMSSSSANSLSDKSFTNSLSNKFSSRNDERHQKFNSNSTTNSLSKKRSSREDERIDKLSSASLNQLHKGKSTIDKERVEKLSTASANSLSNSKTHDDDDAQFQNRKHSFTSAKQLQKKRSTVADERLSKLSSVSANSLSNKNLTRDNSFLKFGSASNNLLIQKSSTCIVPIFAQKSDFKLSDSEDDHPGLFHISSSENQLPVQKYIPPFFAIAQAIAKSKAQLFRVFSGIYEDPLPVVNHVESAVLELAKRCEGVSNMVFYPFRRGRVGEMTLLHVNLPYVINRQRRKGGDIFFTKIVIESITDQNVAYKIRVSDTKRWVILRNKRGILAPGQHKEVFAYTDSCYPLAYADLVSDSFLLTSAPFSYQMSPGAVLNVERDQCIFWRLYPSPAFPLVEEIRIASNIPFDPSYSSDKPLVRELYFDLRRSFWWLPKCWKPKASPDYGKLNRLIVDSPKDGFLRDKLRSRLMNLELRYLQVHCSYYTVVYFCIGICFLICFALCFSGIISIHWHKTTETKLEPKPKTWYEYISMT